MCLPGVHYAPSASFKQIHSASFIAKELQFQTEQSGPPGLGVTIKRTRSPGKTFQRSITHSVRPYCPPSRCQAELESGDRAINHAGTPWDFAFSNRSGIKSRRAPPEAKGEGRKEGWWEGDGVGQRWVPKGGAPGPASESEFCKAAKQEVSLGTWLLRSPGPCSSDCGLRKGTGAQ